MDIDLLKRVLRSPEPNARAAATRVLCYQRGQVPDALALLKVQAGDESPRVRLEAIRAASFFRTAEAATVALTALDSPTDYYIDYTMKETMKQLEQFWRPAVAAGQMIAPNGSGMEYIGQSLKTDELLKLPHSPGVLQAILTRPDVPDATAHGNPERTGDAQQNHDAQGAFGFIGQHQRATPPARRRWPSCCRCNPPPI